MGTVVNPPEQFGTQCPKCEEAKGVYGLFCNAELPTQGPCPFQQLSPCTPFCFPCWCCFTQTVHPSVHIVGITCLWKCPWEAALVFFHALARGC